MTCGLLKRYMIRLYTGQETIDLPRINNFLSVHAGLSQLFVLLHNFLLDKKVLTSRNISANFYDLV